MTNGLFAWRRPGWRDVFEKPSAQGFTLIEIIVVLVIIGLALTMVAGFLPRRNTTAELAGATARVTGALRLARSMAIVQSRAVRFSVTPDGHGFLLDEVAATLGPVVTIFMPTGSIVFAPDGSASGGSLRLSMDLQQRVIQVDWLTGRVTARPHDDTIMVSRAAAGQSAAQGHSMLTPEGAASTRNDMKP